MELLTSNTSILKTQDYIPKPSVENHMEETARLQRMRIRVYITYIQYPIRSNRLVGPIDEAIFYEQVKE